MNHSITLLAGLLISLSACSDTKSENIDPCAGASAVKFDVNDEIGREIAANHALKMAEKGCDYDAFYNDFVSS